MVVSETHRGWCLCFRVGNIDGHDVVSAKVKLTGLFERQYPDGRRFRELSDLKLLRDETPAFSMTWTVMHPLDEDSELASLLSGQVPDTLLMLITTIEGHDKSYANTVHEALLSRRYRSGAFRRCHYRAREWPNDYRFRCISCVGANHSRTPKRRRRN